MVSLLYISLAMAKSKTTPKRCELVCGTHESLSVRVHTISDKLLSVAAPTAHLTSSYCRLLVAHSYIYVMLHIITMQLVSLALVLTTFTNVLTTILTNVLVAIRTNVPVPLRSRCVVDVSRFIAARTECRRRSRIAFLLQVITLPLLQVIALPSVRVF